MLLKKTSLIIVFAFFSIFLLFPNKANAGSSYGGIIVDNPAKYTTCKDTSVCTHTFSTCNNGPSNTDSGGCGTACFGKGNAWSQYANYGCKLVNESPDGESDTCFTVIDYLDFLCSTGDKYNSSNPPVMNYGQCSCAVGTGYKTCCNGTTLANARAYQVDPYDPLEADCGGATEVFCGFGDYPPCGQPACGYAATPTPTPSETPTPTPTPAPTGPTCTQGWNCVSGARACFTQSNCSQGLCIDCPQGSTCTNGACIRNVDCPEGATRNICTTNSC